MSWILHSLVAFLLLGLSIQQPSDKRPNYVILTDGLTGRQRMFVERRCQYLQSKITYKEQKVLVPCVQSADGTVLPNRYPIYGDGLIWRQCERTIQRPFYTQETVEACCSEWGENADGLCVLPNNSTQLPILCHNGGIPEKYNGAIRCLCQPGFSGFVCEVQGNYPAASYYTDVNKQMQGAMYQNQMWRILTAMFLRRRNQAHQMTSLISDMNNRLNSNPPLPPLPALPVLPFNPNVRGAFAQRRPKSFFNLLSNIYRARMMHTFIEEHPELRDQMIMLLASKVATNKRRHDSEENAMRAGYKIRNFLLDRKRKYAIIINKLNQLANMKKMAKSRSEMMYKMMQARRMDRQYMPLYFQNAHKQRMLAHLRNLKMAAMRGKFTLLFKYKLLQNMMANRPEFREFIENLQQKLSGKGEVTGEDNDETNTELPTLPDCVKDFDSSFKQCFVNFGLDPDKALLVTQGMMTGRIPADEQSVATFRAVCSQNRNLESCLNAPVESCQGVPAMAYVSRNIYKIFRVLDTVCPYVPQTQVNEEQPTPGSEQLPDSPKCKNGGQWLFVEDRYVCTCPDGFTGTYCELDEAVDDTDGYEEMPFPDMAVDENANSDLSNQMTPIDEMVQLMPTDQMLPALIVPDDQVILGDQVDQPAEEYPHAGPDMPFDTSYPDPMLQLSTEESVERQRGPVFSNCPTDIITLTIPPDSSVAQLPFQLDARDWRGTPLQWAISHTGFQWSSHSIETVIATARDDIGRLTKCVFSVTVTDPYGPSFVSCPGHITAATDKEPVIWPEIEATDNVGLLTKPKGDHKSGSTFPLGRTLVTFVAEDLAGNVEYCKFVIDVEKSVDEASSEKEIVTSKVEEEKVKPVAAKSSAEASKDAKPLSTVTNPSVDTMMIAMLSVAVGVLVIAIVTAIIACACLKRRKKVWVIEKRPGDIPAIATNPPEYETKGIPPMFYEEAKGETFKGGNDEETARKDALNKKDHLESSKI